MYDLMLYRLPLIMVIATAGRNTVQKCHPQRQHNETLLQLYMSSDPSILMGPRYVDIIIIISTSGSCYVAGFVEKIMIVRQ